LGTMGYQSVAFLRPRCAARVVGFVALMTIIQPAGAGFIRLGEGGNTLMITQYSSNYGGGVHTTPGTDWANIGFSPWTVQFTTAYASMTASFSAWSPLELQLSAQHSVEPATQSTQYMLGDIFFQVDRRHRLTITGTYGVRVVDVASNTVRESGSLLERSVQYALRFNQWSGGTQSGMSTSASISLAVVLPICPGDVTENGHVDGTDLAALLGAWGTPGLGEFVTDLNADGFVNGADLGILLASWGPCSN